MTAPDDTPDDGTDDERTVAIVADTHVPDREATIPDPFRERVRAADHVIHAGDFTAPETLETVRDLATALTAVRGNMDRSGPDGVSPVDLPETATTTVGGVTFAVTHATVRSREDWFETVAALAHGVDAEPVVGVGAHTHRVEDEVYDGVRVLNPGSVTGAAPAERATMLTATVLDGDVDVTVHEA